MLYRHAAVCLAMRLTRAQTIKADGQAQQTMHVEETHGRKRAPSIGNYNVHGGAIRQMPERVPDIQVVLQVLTTPQCRDGGGGRAYPVLVLELPMLVAQVPTWTDASDFCTGVPGVLRGASTTKGSRCGSQTPTIRLLALRALSQPPKLITPLLMFILLWWWVISASFAEDIDIDAIGMTALFVNELRSMEMFRERPLYYDTCSLQFSTARTRQWLTDFARILPANELWFASRQLFIDSVLRDELANGTKQVVIIGSGLDCRALTLHSHSAKFFEIDQPKVLDFKMKRLRSLTYPAEMVRVEYPPGYLHVDLVAVLEKVGFDPTVKTVYIWEGNTPYLPTGKAEELLSTLLQRTVQGSVVVFDTVTNVIANTDGRIDTGDIALNNVIASAASMLNLTNNFMIGPWDVPAAADRLCFDIRYHRDLLSLTREIRNSTNLKDDFLHGNATADSIFSVWASNYYISVVAAKPARAKSTTFGAPDIPTSDSRDL